MMPEWWRFEWSFRDWVPREQQIDWHEEENENWEQSEPSKTNTKWIIIVGGEMEAE